MLVLHIFTWLFFLFTKVWMRKAFVDCYLSFIVLFSSEFLCFTQITQESLQIFLYKRWLLHKMYSTGTHCPSYCHLSCLHNRKMWIECQHFHLLFSLLLLNVGAIACTFLMAEFIHIPKVKADNLFSPSQGFKRKKIGVTHSKIKKHSIWLYHFCLAQLYVAVFDKHTFTVFTSVSRRIGGN